MKKTKESKIITGLLRFVRKQTNLCHKKDVFQNFFSEQVNTVFQHFVTEGLNESGWISFKKFLF